MPTALPGTQDWGEAVGAPPTRPLPSHGPRAVPPRGSTEGPLLPLGCDTHLGCRAGKGSPKLLPNLP